MILRPPRANRTDTLLPYTTRLRSAEAHRRADRFGRDYHAAEGREGHRLQEAPPSQLSPPQRASPAAHDPEDRCDRRREEGEEGRAQEGRGRRRRRRNRSEEHTSELQSLMRISYAVFCLKKKNKHKTNTNMTKPQKKTKTNNK